MANQTGKKADVEFIIAGDDNVSQIFKGIASELQVIQNKTRATGREVTSSMDQVGDSTRKAGREMETVGDRLRRIGDGTAHIKRLNQELEQTDDKARTAGREMERGFRDGGRAADQAANKVRALQQRVVEVSREMRGMVDALNHGTAGFQSFVGDQIRRGAYVGGLAVTGFAAHSVKKEVDKEYEFAKLGAVLKSNYYENGKFNEAAYKKDFSELQAFISKEGLRPDREANTMSLIGIATELAKNNMDPKQVMAALSTVSDFAQATDLDPDVAAKYLANKAEAAKMEYTPETFQKLADQFVQTVDMSSLDPRDLLYAERYTDFANAMGGVDYAVTQAMQVALSKISVDGEKAGTALRTLFLESTKLTVPDSALDNASSAALAKKVERLLADFNAINQTVEKDGSVAKENKGTEKIMRKTALLNRYMGTMTSDEQMEVSSMLFGKEAASVGTIFAGDDYKEFLGYIETIRNSNGITKRYADDRAATDKGQLVALGKAIEEIQGKVGRSLNPLLDATTAQLLKLATEGKFSFDEINKGVEESARLLSKELNPEIAEVFEQLSNLATNTFQIGVALSPLAEGTFKSLVKLLNGDVTGAVNEIVLAIDATDLKIENLPGELQGLATAAKNAAIFLAAIAALNKSVEVAETGKKIWDGWKGMKEVITGEKNGSGPKVDTDDSKIIKANVVNVYGEKVNGGTKGNSGKGGPMPNPSNGRHPTTGNGTPIPENRTSPKGDWWKNGNWKATVGAAGIGAFWLWGLTSYGDYMDTHQAKNFHDKYGPVGAEQWFPKSAKDISLPPGEKNIHSYPKETKGVVEFLLSKKGTKYAPYLTEFSDELLREANFNAAKKSQYLLNGYNGGDMEVFLQKRLNEFYSIRNGEDFRSPEYEKKSIRAANKEREEERLLNQERTDRLQYIREMENDPFIRSSYKRQMLDEITRPNNPGSSNSISLIPTLLEHLNKIQEKPITVHSDHNLKVLVEDNRSVQVSMESASEYARRTYDNRTLTPQQAVKMRQLE
ncbi:phage tail tape measure protein [Brevibacillus borstelensis]|uniref:phage tail tape measure protein n=1 Tax=Brevibacillus borstelensis TaxID=45462 RepID=UPI0030BB2E83